ncbi:MAG: MBL fold metallo-hydrolase [Clostridia bacterium]|nr:MBL fold metallo-hydrolase [Clostridia bacterium]
MMNAKMAGLVLLTLMLTIFASAASAIPVYFSSGIKDGPYEIVPTLDACPFDADTPVLDVIAVGIGRGDCYLIRCGGENMLIDGGEAYRYRRVRYFLEDNGIYSTTETAETGRIKTGEVLDYMLLTHAHRDHYQVQAELLQHDYLPRFIYTTHDATSKDRMWPEYRKWIDKKQVPYRRIEHGEDLQVGGANLHVYRWTGAEANTRGENNKSAVLKITYGDAALLLTADLEGYGQRWLIDNFGDELDVDIGKAPHHGISQSYPDLLERMSPSLMIINDERSSAASYERQMAKHHIPRLYAVRNIHMMTDGKIWYVWVE